RNIDEMLENGIIRNSVSPYQAGVIMVPKKGSDEMRVCIDFRGLNAVTVSELYPLPRLDDILDSFCGSTIFSRLDLKSGYWQLPLDKSTIPLTAFSTPDGHYEFLRLPFGLKNAPA